ncbi:response regulator of citrate/malate metabolism [Desulfosporosinus acidiphilus SJ4]|uniref:Response regulator of citrate/malate metabolism n=1 Tax=Desulfosporosinus acidiphilus (strain DSM 22704 / JCM 16185 / SJ4) TaxID=646529 RepID=I4D1S2_DESAJ|nr:cache domain-containing protein [Desulfosporosinus acidiphilus]AFM39746.1 response regulator of citrate/malate metabolism [Desulfosporosinus acidiphilus SJ4]
MRSLKQQILILLLGSLVLLAACFITILGWYMKDKAEAAAFIKAQTDLATCEEIIEKTYPGSWAVKNGELYKGSEKINLNNNLVDHLSSLTGDTVTIFLGDTRVATTVRGSNDERAIGTKVSASVAQTVLQDGQNFVGKANVIGQWYETGYMPLRAENGLIVGMFYVGISHSYDQKTINGSLITFAVLGFFLTLFVSLIAWFFLQKFVINPLHNITLGTRDVATGHLTEKIKVSGAKEIEELEEAFNQMVEKIQSLTDDLNRRTDDFDNNLVVKDDNPEVILEKGEEFYEPPSFLTDLSGPTSTMSQPPTDSLGEEDLPKGLNQATLDHIVQFIQTTQRPLSAEEVAESVKLTRVTVRRYLEYLEQQGLVKSEQKYGRVGRPVKLFIPI